MLATATGVADTTVDAALTALETAATALHDLNFEVLSNPERVTVLQRLETVARMLPSVGHTLIAQIQQQWVYRELGNGNLTWVLSDALRITPGDARTPGPDLHRHRCRAEIRSDRRPAHQGHSGVLQEPPAQDRHRHP